MAAAVPVLVGFGAYERRKKALDGSPLVDLDLFRQRSFVPGLLVAGIFFMGIPAFFLIFSLWLQIGLGFSALHAGLTGAPFAVGSALASAASVRLAPTLGRRILSAGSLLLVAGMLALIWTVDRYGGAVDSWQLLPALLLCGLGLGSVVAPLVNVVLAGIRGQDAGAASGVLTTVQQVGGAVGVAVIGVVFFGLLGSQAAGVADDLAPGLRAGLQGAGLPPAATEQVAAGFRTCFEDRANAKDPSAVPPSCAQAQAQAQGQDRRRSAGSWPPPPTPPAARASPRRSSAPCCSRSLVFLAVFLLVFLLPDARGDAAAQHPGAPAA